MATKTSFALCTVGLMAVGGVAAAPTGTQLLEDLHKGTRQRPVALKDLPQNFGGEGAKIPNDRPREYTDTAVKLAMADEAVFQAVMADVVHPLEDMFTAGVFSLGGISAPGAEYVLKAEGPSIEKGRIVRQAWGAAARPQGATEASRWWEKATRSLGTVEYARLSPYAYSTPISRRDPLTSLPLAYTVDCRLDLRALARGARHHQRGTFRMEVAKDSKTGKWAVSRMEMMDGEKLSSSVPAFKEAASFAAGAPANHLRKEAIRRGGYALALGDIDGDGQADMVVGHLGPVELFKGSKDGTFTKIDNAAWGVGQDTLVKSVVIADFDNDGRKDLLFVRFAPSEEEGRDIVLYKNLGAKFTRSTSIRNRYPAYYAMPSAVADFDGNGLLDFYVGFPGAKDFTVLSKESQGFAGKREPNPQGLFTNIGNFTFEETTRERLPYSKEKNAYGDGYPETALVFPHSSAGLDYDLDGDMDIVVVDDKANLSPLYRNDGAGKFSQVADKIGMTNYDYGMGFAAADLDQDGRLEFVYTNVNFLPAERMQNALERNFTELSARPGSLGVRVFKSTDGSRYADVSGLTGVNGCGEGVGGVEVVDYDNDGYPDIYVANGLWSGNSRRHDLSSLFVRANTAHTYDFREVLGEVWGVEQANTSFMRVLAGFEGEVESQKKVPGLRPSMAGFQRNCLFRNNRNGTFTEVGFLEGVDSMADGYIVGTADLDKDGRMDLVLRNGDPGTEQNRFPSVQVYMNRLKVPPKSVVLALRGTKSNRDAVGSLVEAKIGGMRVLRHLIANNGAVQSENLLHFGLGSHSKVDELTIRWPSGTIQKMKDVKPGRYQVTEQMDSRKPATARK